MSAEVAQVLREAADVLERSGWVPYQACRLHTGPRCTVEAIHYVAGTRSDLWDSACEALLAHVHAPALGDWNDAQESAEPVVATLRAAADEAERS